MQQFVKKEIGLGDQELIVEDGCYVDCTFDGLIAEGVFLSGSLFVGCKLKNTDLYWCHAFRCHFIDCEFVACDLRGNFDEAVFVRCRFNDCQYGSNELGGTTEWENAVAIETTVAGPPLPIIKKGD